ncbi:MAG: J domain-containing protein, partial [Anaerolineae bacterium]|nr:J domain-containing protein [Anaerolineae bacterium]
MDASQDLYAVLGVKPEVSQDDLRGIYRTLARRLHPDANPHAGAAIQFREIAEAYETLGNSENRRKYDNLRRRLAAEPNYFIVEVTSSKRVLPILGEPQV